MKCLNCGSEELKYDELSDMYFCPKCNRLYDKDEIIEDMNEDDIEYDFEDGIKEWKEEEDLNGFSLTVLSIIQSIPIIGLIVPILISNSSVKVGYKKQFAYRFIGQVVICIVLIIFGAVLYINDKTYVVDNLQHNMNLIVQSVRGSYISKDDIQIPNLTTVPKDSMIDTDAYVPEVGPILQGNWEYFDGITMTGKQVKSLVDSTVDSMVAYLLQTPDIAERHGKDSYRNFGYVLAGAESDSTKSNVFFVDKQSVYSFYTDDYGEYKDSGISDMSNSKCIFYINPKKSYTFNIIKNDSDEVIGFMFTEVVEEVKTNGNKKRK